MSKIILITHQKGGVGKSTLAFNLAQNLKENASVCIIDMDYQGSISQLKDVVADFDIIALPGVIDTIKTLPYDFIFIDTPPYLSDHLPKLCGIADLIMVPTKAGVLDLMAIRSTIDIIKENNGKDKAMIVFNMVKPNTTLTDDIKTEVRGYDIVCAKTMISDLVAFTRSVLVGGVQSDQNAQKQIDKLTKEVLTKLI